MSTHSADTLTSSTGRQRRESTTVNPVPQSAPGTSAAIGHTLENAIPMSIFPIATDKFCFCFCGLPGRGKTHIARRLARYLCFFHAIPVRVFNATEYRQTMCGLVKEAEWFDLSNVEAETAREVSHLLSVNFHSVFITDFACIVIVEPDLQGKIIRWRHWILSHPQQWCGYCGLC